MKQVGQQSGAILLADEAGGFDIGFSQAGIAVRDRYGSVYSDLARAREFAVGSVTERSVREAEGEERSRDRLDNPFVSSRDISNIAESAPAIALAQPQIIAGSPPHLPHAVGRPPEAFLMEAFAVIVAAARPRYFVMETNIGVARSWAFDRLFNGMLRQSGYGLSQTIVRVAQFGSAERRRRLICAGCLDEPDNWLNAYLNQYRSRELLTVADVLGPDYGTSLADSAPDHDGRDDPFQASTQEEGDGPEDEPSGADWRETDLVLPVDLPAEARLYFCQPGGRGSGPIHRTDRPAPSLMRTSLRKLTPSYRPKPGDQVDLRRLPQPDLDAFLQLSGFLSARTRSDGAALVFDRDDVSQFQKRLLLANSTPPPLAEAIGRAILDHRAGLQPGLAHSRTLIAGGTSAAPQANADMSSPQERGWTIPAAYRVYLESHPEQKLTDKTVAQLLTDLKKAKAKVAHYELKSASAELDALDKVFKLESGGSAVKTPSERARESQLRRALRFFADWEYRNSREYKLKLRAQEEAKRSVEDDLFFQKLDADRQPASDVIKKRSARFLAKARKTGK